MIKIKILIEKDLILNYTSQGHALDLSDMPKIHPSLAVNEASICSAVSMLEYNFLYSLQALVDIPLTKVKIEKGIFILDIIKKVNVFAQQSFKEKEVIFKTLSQSLLIGLRALKKKYPQQISLHINKK